MMALGAIFLVIWLLFYFIGLKHNAMFDVLVEKEYPLKEIYGVGYAVLELFKYKYINPDNFIVEDLGDIRPETERLREHYGFTRQKVLQFSLDLDNGYDIDAPENFQLDILRQDLEKIAGGEDIYCPEYLPNGTGVSVPLSKFVPSEKIIVVEGMATMYDGIKDLFDIKIYIETDLDVRRKRFLTRACGERNQDMENALKHWEYILSAGQKYIIPSRKDMDIILNGDSSLDYFSHILEYIHTITNNFEQ